MPQSLHLLLFQDCIEKIDKSVEILYSLSTVELNGNNKNQFMNNYIKDIYVGDEHRFGMCLTLRYSRLC